MVNKHRSLFERFANALHRAMTLGRASITTRLAIAFAVVAILALASNFLVDNGASIIEIALAPDDFAGPVKNSQTPKKELTLYEAERGQAASQLRLALGNFDKTVRDHVDAPSAESGARYTETLRELQNFALAYADVQNATKAELLTALRAHEASAAALVRVARDKRISLANYSSILRQLNMRLRGSIDRAWKILGRIVARQSLLELSAELDDIQNRFATREGAGKPGGMARLDTAEQAFQTTLKTNESVLRRSQGAEWFDGMNADSARLISERDSLVALETSFALLDRAFTTETAALIQILASPAEHTGRQANEQPPKASARSVIGRTASRPAKGSLAESSSSGPSRSLVATLSIIVMAVLAYICTVTVLSIVRPVRRLLTATSQIAQGDDGCVVAPGGIRELDELGLAFNAMAARLSAARAETRATLSSLEEKVDERTRQLRHLAEKDPLTGLANRRQLLLSLNDSIARAAEKFELVAAFFLDIDNFKTLNDSMGHGYGDRVLTAIAKRLDATARPSGFAARLGGDEFLIVHEGAETIEEVVAAGMRLVQAFHAPIEVDGRELIVSVSVGASVYPLHETTVDALLRAADAALFDAKAKGRSRLTLFSPELLVNASRKFAIEQRLRRAIEKGEFELFYQPEVNVQTFEVSRVEALIRWRAPDGTYASPDEFLGVAGESGLIVEIDDWVLRTAIESTALWLRGEWPKARVAINVSPRQFLDYRFVENLLGLLKEFSVPTDCLEIELTESVLQTGPMTIAALSRLRAAGIAVALDDFGTGYSSLASLEQLPLTRIKLDRSLIARMDNNPRSASIARATIGLCSDLGVAVTAEGVERIEQFTALIGYPSVSLQGYLLARPVSRDALLPLLEQMPARCAELIVLAREAPLPMATELDDDTQSIAR